MRPASYTRCCDARPTQSSITGPNARRRRRAPRRGRRRARAARREERGVDAAEDDLGPALTRGAPDLIATQRVARVDADADHVARLHLLRVERFERLVADDGIAEARRRGGREHEQPAWRDDGGAEGNVAWVHEKHAHSGISRVMVDGGGDAGLGTVRTSPRSPGPRGRTRGRSQRRLVLHPTRPPMRRPWPRRAKTSHAPAPMPGPVTRAKANRSS